MLSHRSNYFFLPALFLLMLLGASDAHGCSCGPDPTVLDAYNGADVVVIVTALSVEKASPEKSAPDGQMSNGENYVDGVMSTAMRVEQVFKGKLLIGDEMIFVQGGGGNCIWTFNEKSIGKKFLFYLHSRHEGSSRWIAGTCGRSGGVDYASDDLLYLNNMEKQRGRTRISGTLRFAYDAGESIAGRKIRIVGATKTYEVETDENGVYEIYDVPAGKYSIEPEIPRGWKVAKFWLGYSPSFAGGTETTPKKIPIVLEDKKHAGLDIRFEIDNAVRGHIYDPAGGPMKDVCLDLVPADGTKGRYLADCSEQDGSFVIDEIPPGAYVLMVNDDGKMSSTEPFPAFYYPNARKREDATVFHIAIGDFIDNLEIHPTQAVETITVEGVFYYSDGKPVVNEWVEFKSARESKAGAKDEEEDEESDSRAKTDSNGRFSIKILKGAKGSLWGEMYTYEGEYENCPKLDRLIKQSGEDVPTIKTLPLEVQAQTNLYDVVLKYPFPSCKKAKEQ